MINWGNLLLGISLLFTSCSDKIEKAKTIQLGMSELEVINKLGRPTDSIKAYLDTNAHTFLYITPGIFADDIQIIFDNNSEKVIKVILPKGE